MDLRVSFDDCLVLLGDKRSETLDLILQNGELVLGVSKLLLRGSLLYGHTVKRGDFLARLFEFGRELLLLLAQLGILRRKARELRPEQICRCLERSDS